MRPDWNKIKSEFMAGASYGILSNRHGICKSQIYKKAQKEGWPKQRERLVNAVETKTIEKTADAVASNAAKLERAKGLAIDRLLSILERFPEDAGDVYRKFGDGIENKYNLLNIATALEKLDRNSAMDSVDDPLTQLLARIDSEACASD